MSEAIDDATISSDFISFDEYLVLDQNPAGRQAWLYRRATGWEQENGAPGGSVKLASLDFETPHDGLYA